jgi:MFS family permease
MTLAPVAKARVPHRPSVRKAYYTVIVLSLAYAFSFLDRQLPNLLLQSIKTDLHLTDTQVSLLSGLSFVLFYALAALPVSSLADRWSRKGVIGWGILLWGLATTVCGGATTFTQFFIARMGVGLGESALSPATYSLIGDLFPPHRRARATAIYAAGSAIGTGLALLAGAGTIRAAGHMRAGAPQLLGDIAPWKLVLAGTGLLTLGLLPFILAIADPRRTADNAAPAIPLRAVFGLLWRERRAYSPLLIGIPLMNMASSGFIAWAPTLFIRTHGWSVAQTGLGMGLASVIGGIAGSLGGGWLSDTLSKRSPDAPLWISVGGMTGSVVLAGLICVVPSPGAQLVLTGAVSTLMYPVGVMGIVSLQQIAPPTARALVSSIFLLTATLVGIGLGPTLVAVMTDFVFRDEALVGISMALVFLLTLCVSGPLIVLNRHAFIRVALAQQSAH